MGYYIQTPVTFGKADYIVRNMQGIIVTQNEITDTMIVNQGVIVVMNNGAFESVGFAYDKNEFMAFTQPSDLRLKQFVIIERALAEELTGYH